MGGSDGMLMDTPPTCPKKSLLAITLQIIILWSIPMFTQRV
jgi:hypothetical protein